MEFVNDTLERDKMQSFVFQGEHKLPLNSLLVRVELPHSCSDPGAEGNHTEALTGTRAHPRASRLGEQGWNGDRHFKSPAIIKKVRGDKSGPGSVQEAHSTSQEQQRPESA